MHPENTAVYEWAYLVNGLAGKSFRSIVRFYKSMRLTSSDWVGNFIWGSPVVALAPPREHDNGLALNIDTYLTYVDKQINSRS